MHRTLRTFIVIMMATTLLVANKVSSTPKSDTDTQCSTKFDINEEEIGRGTFGRVFNAFYWHYEDQEKPPPVVLKTFSGDDAKTNWELEHKILLALDTEFTRSLADVSNSDKVRRFSKLYETCMYKGERAIVTDYIPFGFEQKIGGKRTIVKDIGLIHGVILAVDQLHNLGFAHLDLKPENVRIDANNVVKLIDFGISERLEHNEEDEVLGTPPYMAPEMLISKVLPTTQYVKSKVDTWGVGTIAYELLMGQRLLSVEEDNQLNKCLKTFYNPKHFGYRRIKTFKNDVLTSFLIAIYVRTATALQKQGQEITFVDTLPSVFWKAARKCADEVGFEARPETALLSKLMEREEVTSDTGKQLTSLIFGKLLQFDPEDRAEMSDVLNDVQMLRAKMSDAVNDVQVLRTKTSDAVNDVQVPRKKQRMKAFGNRVIKFFRKLRPRASPRHAQTIYENVNANREMHASPHDVEFP